MSALTAKAADTGNFTATDIRAYKVHEDGADYLAVYLNLTVKNHAGDECGYGAYLYTESPSASLNISKFIPFKVESNAVSKTDFCLKIPYSSIPFEYRNDKLRIVIGAYIGNHNGGWQQDGSWWGPAFVPSQLSSAGAPRQSNADEDILKNVRMGYIPGSHWVIESVKTTVDVIFNGQPQGKKLGVIAALYDADNRKIHDSAGKAVSIFHTFTADYPVTKKLNYNFTLAYSDIPPHLLDQKLKMLVAPYVWENGDWKQCGSLWGPVFVPSQLRGGATPVKPVAGSKPVLTWIDLPATTEAAQVKVKVGVKSASALTAAHIYVNGMQLRGVKAVTNDGYDMMLNEVANLTQGTNTIKAVVTNAAGTIIEERTVTRQAKTVVNPVKKTDPVKEITDQNLRRLALVVGNSKYPGQELANTISDADAMNLKLRSLGFDVIYVTEANRRTLDTKINEFGAKARGYDVAMFYYAGHGIQYNGMNYLIPVDADLASESDIEYECTNVNRVLSKLDESGCKMKIIALDACRNNPFERSWHRGAGQGRGLSAINAPVGTFISYATSPGTTASDGQGDHSPYTEALLGVLDIPGLPIETVFKRVATKVFQSTNQTQTPWYSSSLFEGEFIFNPSR